MEASDLQHVRQLHYAWLYINSLHTLSLALWAAFHLVIHPNESQASHIEWPHGATVEEASWIAITFSVSYAEVTIVEHGIQEQSRSLIQKLENVAVSPNGSYICLS